MDYDFSGLCADHIETIDKRLTSLKKSFLKQIRTTLIVLNDPAVNEKRGEIMQSLDDLLSDEVKRSVSLFAGCMNKVIGQLRTQL